MLKQAAEAEAAGAGAEGAVAVADAAAEAEMEAAADVAAAAETVDGVEVGSTQSADDGDTFDLMVGPGRYCSPHHRMPYIKKRGCKVRLDDVVSKVGQVLPDGQAGGPWPSRASACLRCGACTSSR